MGASLGRTPERRPAMNAPLHRPWIANVALLYESDACLPWPFGTRGGRRPQDAYPALGGSGYAHVLLCELTHGPRPSPDHEAEHLCGFHLCMNKRHIRWALHRENCQRRTAHGTQLIGERHNMAKLTEIQVRAIRAAPKLRGSGRALAKHYGVCPATICVIRSRKNWSHL
jgi:hypothetical protein